MAKILTRAKCRKIPNISSEKMMEWISTKEGSRLFFVSEDWIRSLIASGRLYSFKVKNRRFVHGPSLKNLANDLGNELARKRRKRRRVY